MTDSCHLFGRINTKFSTRQFYEHLIRENHPDKFNWEKEICYKATLEGLVPACQEAGAGGEESKKNTSFARGVMIAPVLHGKSLLEK